MRVADPDLMARRWLGYCLAWARRQERRHGDPVGRYHDAAVAGLLRAIARCDSPDGTVVKAHLDACLASCGRDATRTARRRAARAKAWRVEGEGIPGLAAVLVDRRTPTPPEAAMLREAADFTVTVD